MRTWTVILGYPEHVSDHGDTYMTHVEAESVPEAQKTAAKELFESMIDEESANLDDRPLFPIIAVMEGEIQDLKTEAEIRHSHHFEENHEPIL